MKISLSVKLTEEDVRELVLRHVEYTVPTPCDGSFEVDAPARFGYQSEWVVTFTPDSEREQSSYVSLESETIHGPIPSTPVPEPIIKEASANDDDIEF